MLNKVGNEVSCGQSGALQHSLWTIEHETQRKVNHLAEREEMEAIGLDLGQDFEDQMSLADDEDEKVKEE